MESTLMYASDLPRYQRQLTDDELVYFRVRDFHPNKNLDSVRQTLRVGFVATADRFVQRRGTKGWQAVANADNGEQRWWSLIHSTPLAAYVEAELREWKY